MLDLNLPGMCGLDLQQNLKELGVVVPVIFLSGRADIPRVSNGLGLSILSTPKGVMAGHEAWQ